MARNLRHLRPKWPAVAYQKTQQYKKMVTPYSFVHQQQSVALLSNKQTNKQTIYELLWRLSSVFSFGILLDDKFSGKVRLGPRWKDRDLA